MSILNLGKVRPVLLGAYSEATEYKFLNGVSYNGSYYFYINETASTGNLPTDTEYWAIAAQKGDKGDLGASIATAAFVDDDMVFTLNDDTTVTLVGAKTALKGDKGDMGTIYTPELSAEGVLSFTNDGELDNPTPVDLTGPQGNPAPNTIFQYSINGTDWTDVATDAQWYRQSGDNGTTWSEAIELPSVEALALKAAAETAAGNAASSETAAQRAQAGAETAQAGAETARTGAETARARAERAEGAAALSERNAKISEDAAEFAASEAAASEVSARNYLNMITDTGSSLPEAIMQNNLNVNSSFDRIEVTEAELVDIEKVVLNAELSTRMSAMRAAQSETNARISASESAAAKTAAEFARNESQSARNDSQAARNDSRIAKAAAETAAGNAASSETAAQRAQAGAGTAQTGAETARTGAETARASAERAEGAAEAARDAASVSEANAQRTCFNVAQLALQLGNPLLELENQNTLAEAILQENLLINNIYDRLEGGIYAAI